MKRKQSTGAQRWGQVHVEILKNCGGLPPTGGIPHFFKYYIDRADAA